MISVRRCSKPCLSKCCGSKMTQIRSPNSLSPFQQTLHAGQQIAVSARGLWGTGCIPEVLSGAFARRPADISRTWRPTFCQGSVLRQDVSPKQHAWNPGWRALIRLCMRRSDHGPYDDISEYVSCSDEAVCF